MSEPPNKDKKKSGFDGADSTSFESSEELPGTSAPQDKRRIRKVKPTVENPSQISQDSSQEDLRNRSSPPVTFSENSERPPSNDNDYFKAQPSKEDAPQPSTSLGALTSQVSGVSNSPPTGSNLKKGGLWQRAKGHVLPSDGTRDCKPITDWPESGCIYIPLRPPGSDRNESQEGHDTEESEQIHE